MKRVVLILLSGGLVGLLAYCGVYFFATSTPRALKSSRQPELAWLQHEFALNKEEFNRISDLHQSYLPQCRERCRKIEALNSQLTAELARAAGVTPEIERLLQESAQMRAACQVEMLKHFFEVSSKMPAEQGRRYLSWVAAKSCLVEGGMNHDAVHPGEPTGSAHHP